MSTSNFCKTVFTSLCSVSALIIQIIHARMNQLRCMKISQTFRVFVSMISHFFPVDLILFSLCGACPLAYFFQDGRALRISFFSVYTIFYNTKHICNSISNILAKMDFSELPLEFVTVFSSFRNWHFSSGISARGLIVCEDCGD